MNPDWVSALLGGIMIGGGASLFLLANGRIAGVSGAIGNLTKRVWPTTETILFITGFIAAPLVYSQFSPLPEIDATRNIAILIIGGLAVGIGSQLGGGCTAGHGVCGNARFSKRSIIATLMFIGVGAGTVLVLG